MKKFHLLTLGLFLSGSLCAQTEWFPIETGTNKNLRCIDFVDEEIGYISGDKILLKTVNGGATWTEVDVDTLLTNNNQDYSALDIQFFSESHGRMVLGQWQGMAETFDGGITWSQMIPLSSGFCQFGAIYYFDPDHGMAGGAGCFESAIIDRYENGNWSLTTIPPTFNTEDLVTNFDFIDENNGMACTAIGRILRTADGGLNWDTIPNPEPTSYFTDIAYVDADTVYATFSREFGFGTLISVDGGLTWDNDWETATFFYPRMNTVHVNGAGIPFMGGLNGNDPTTGVIFDKGPEFWNFLSIEFPIQDIDSHSDSITFLVGDSGAVYVNVNPLLLGLDATVADIHLNLHPNPAQDRIHVSMDMDAFDVRMVNLYDLQGNQILVSFTRTNNGISVILPELTAGQYLIEIQTDQGRSRASFLKE